MNFKKRIDRKSLNLILIQIQMRQLERLEAGRSLDRRDKIQFWCNCQKE